MEFKDNAQWQDLIEISTEVELGMWLWLCYRRDARALRLAECRPVGLGTKMEVELPLPQA